MDFKIDRSVSFAIGRTNHVLQSEIRTQLANTNFKLSPEGASILLLLASIGQPIRVSQLAKLAVRDGTTLKRQIDGLVKLDFVVQAKDESDGRVVLISLTEKGKEIVESVRNLQKSIADAATQGIQNEELEVMLRALTKIRSNLQSK